MEVIRLPTHPYDVYYKEPPSPTRSGTGWRGRETSPIILAHRMNRRQMPPSIKAQAEEKW